MVGIEEALVEVEVAEAGTKKHHLLLIDKIKGSRRKLKAPGAFLLE
jgi:hypothetical protein